MALLNVEGLTKYFGGLAALNEIDLDLDQGELLGLIGPNGAGKTTFFNILTGFIRPSKGKVYFKGKDVTGLSPHNRAKMGMVRTFQQTGLLESGTVIENMLVGHFLQDKTGYWSTFLNTRSACEREKDNLKRAMELLEQAGLFQLKDEPVKNLPHGSRRILGICMALAGGPELLLLDEPVTGMNSEEISSALELIRRIRNMGVTIIVVEHNMRVIMSLSDRIIVLNYGSKIAEGQPREIKEDREVIEAYLGKPERGE